MTTRWPAPDSFTIGQNSPATAVPVLGNDSDPDGDARTITGKTNGSHGTVVITGAGTGLTYQPTAGYLGPDTFTYTISDGHGGSAIGHRDRDRRRRTTPRTPATTRR